MKYKSTIKRLDEISLLIRESGDLSGECPLKDAVRKLANELLSENDYENHRAGRNLYIMGKLWLDKIDGREMAISQEEIKRRLLLWIKNLVSRLEKII